MSEQNIYNMNQQELLQMLTPPKPEDKGFLGNLMTRRILNPLQERLGMRESLQDQMRREQIGASRLDAFQNMQDMQRRVELINMLASSGIDRSQIENLSLSALEGIVTGRMGEVQTSPTGVITQNNILTGQQQLIAQPPQEIQSFNLEQAARNRANENAALGGLGPLRLPFENVAQLTPSRLQSERAEKESKRDIAARRQERIDERAITRIDTIVQPVYESMRTIGNQRASLDQLVQIMDAGAQTGATAPMLATARNIGLSLGLNVTDPTPEQLFAAISNRIALPLVKSLGNNPTDTDLQLILDSAPSLSQTEQGNRLLIQTIRLKLERDELLARAVMQYEDENAGLLAQNPEAYRRGLDRAVINVQNSPEFKGKMALQLRADFARQTNRQTNPESLADKY